MKTYSIDHLIHEVRLKYDEFSSNGCDMISFQDDNDMDAVILSCIPPAYKFVILNAENSILEGKNAENISELTIDDDLVGHITLPNDFLRGITLRLSSWKSSASNIIDENSPEYRMQSDPYTCGTFQCPVVALVHTAKGKELEFFKAKTKDDAIRSFVYVADLPTEFSEVFIPERISEAFIYYVAALTATTFRDDVANDFFKIAKGLLGIG